MVEALLSAAAESDSPLLDDIMMSGMNDEFISSNDHHQTPLRFCEFCNSSNTPTWRRGPAGKGSLCNACGIKWRLRKRLKKNEKGSPSPPPTIPDKKVSPLVIKPPKKRKEPDVHTKSPSKYKEKDISAEYFPPSSSHKEGGSKRKKYYCKYCDQTFSLSQFRNSQQFGAHCSNCSRRPREDDGLFDSGNHFRYDRYVSPYSPSDRVSPPSTPESPNPTNNNRDGLLLRLLHVVEHQLVDVHELAEIRDELSAFKSELINREEARRAELGVIRARVKEELAELRTGLRRSIATHEQLAAHRLMEMEQTIRIRTNGGGLLF